MSAEPQAPAPDGRTIERLIKRGKTHRIVTVSGVRFELRSSSQDALTDVVVSREDVVASFTFGVFASQIKGFDLCLQMPGGTAIRPLNGSTARELCLDAWSNMLDFTKAVLDTKSGRGHT